MSTVKPIAYQVICDGMRYKYALHSVKKDRVIFPSQILNILEYCLFKKIRGGWNEELTIKSFPFDVELYQGGELIEKWEDKDQFLASVFDLLKQYYKNIPEKHFSNNQE